MKEKAFQTRHFKTYVGAVNEVNKKKAVLAELKSLI